MGKSHDHNNAIKLSFYEPVAAKVVKLIACCVPEYEYQKHKSSYVSQ